MIIQKKNMHEGNLLKGMFSAVLIEAIFFGAIIVLIKIF
jgi:hypothetical protein